MDETARPIANPVPTSPPSASAPAPASASAPASMAACAPVPARAAPTAAASSATAAERARLEQALRSENAGDRIHALRELRDRGAVELLPELLELDLQRDPDAAPTLITVTAQLAARADPAQRLAAASRLAEWLRSESERASADARGNLSSIVEALGAIDSPAAVSALGAALDSERLPLHVATVAVTGLARLSGGAQARPAVERFRARLNGIAAADSFERELQAEAAAQADRALAHWAG